VREELKLDPELSELFANLCWEQEITLCPAILDQLEPEPEPVDHKITKLLDKGYENDEWWMKIRDEMLKPHGILLGLIYSLFNLAGSSPTSIYLVAWPVPLGSRVAA
jgi:hypothetical protein